jgi:integrase
LRLTAKKIRDAKSSDRTRILWDLEVKGLGLRITPANVKSFVLSYRFEGRKRLMTLARESEISLEDVRRLAGRLLVQVRQGIDPMEERRARRETSTVEAAMARYLNEHLERRIANGRLTSGTLKEYRRQAVKYVFPSIGTKRVNEIERRHIEQLLEGLPPVMANRVCALLSAFFNQIEYWELRPQHTNPARGIEKAREEERDRTLSPVELSSLGKVLEGNRALHPSAVLAIRLAALTGLRIGEILQMRWDEIDFERGFLILPKSKTGRRIHTLPSACLALLAEAPRAGVYVIAGRDRDKPMDYSAVRRHWKLACETAGVRNARLHDLRRTIITEAAALGVGSHLLRDMVGHKTTAMADRYARQAGAPLVDLRERMGESMMSKLAGLPEEKDMPE